MSIETIIQSWKSDEEAEGAFPNPVGEELSDQELQEVTGGALTTTFCDTFSCDPISCVHISCGNEPSYCPPGLSI